MRVIRFTLQPRAPAATEFRGDILIGHMLWQYAFKHGAAALEDLLQRVPQDPPAMSDLFPEGMLPVPLLPLRRKDFPKNTSTERHKKIKRMRHLPEREWQSLRRGLSRRSLADTLAKLAEAASQEPGRSEANDVHKLQVEEVAELHCTIDRRTGTTPAEGGLYARPVKHYGRKRQTEHNRTVTEPATLHGFLFPGVFGDEALELLKAVGQFGYGADASTGLGVFVVPSHELADWSVPEGANAWMSLSHHLPDPMTKPAEGFYGLDTHYGRLGASFANDGNPYKLPLLLCTPGSIWKGLPSRPPGAVLERVAKRAENIRHLGYTIPYYFRWEDD